MAYDVCRLQFDQHGTGASEFALSRAYAPEFGQFDAAIVAMLSIFARRAREPLVSLNPELNFWKLRK
jgi:hypothetical protein